MDPSDDDNITNEKALNIARKMFFGGFLFLPWLWLCNYFYFREYLNKPNISSQVRFYAKGSLVGFAVMTSVLIVWFTVYITQRRTWGPSADDIALIIPEGD